MAGKNLDTRVIHAGQSPEPVTGAVMPPVFQTSTYAQPWPAKHTGYEYSRSQNPTREALERCVADLESATHGIAFGSGLAATSTIMQTLSAGDRVVCGDDLYGGTFRLFDKVYARLGLEFSFVDLARRDPARSSRRARSWSGSSRRRTRCSRSPTSHGWPSGPTPSERVSSSTTPSRPRSSSGRSSSAQTPSSTRQRSTSTVTATWSGGLS